MVKSVKSPSWPLIHTSHKLLIHQPSLPFPFLSHLLFQQMIRRTLIKILRLLLGLRHQNPPLLQILCHQLNIPRSLILFNRSKSILIQNSIKNIHKLRIFHKNIGLINNHPPLRIHPLLPPRALTPFPSLFSPLKLSLQSLHCSWNKFKSRDSISFAPCKVNKGVVTTKGDEDVGFRRRKEFVKVGEIELRGVGFFSCFPEFFSSLDFVPSSFPVLWFEGHFLRGFLFFEKIKMTGQRPKEKKNQKGVITRIFGDLQEGKGRKKKEISCKCFEEKKRRKKMDQCLFSGNITEKERQRQTEKVMKRHEEAKRNPATVSQWGSYLVCILCRPM